MTSNFTQAQRDAVARMYDIAKEHFDGAVICVLASGEQGDGRETETTDGVYCGGRVQAIGLLTEMRELLLQDGMPDEGEE